MLEAFQAFDADVQKLPQWVQIWMDVIGVSLTASIITLLIGKSTRMLGLGVLATIFATVIVMVFMHAQMGMVRLLGIVHVVLWTPMVFLLWQRFRRDPPTKFYSMALLLLIVICSVALVFDYYDVARWIIGQRAPIV